MTARVAFVVQRCGLEVNGGAELLCRLVAQQMAGRCRTEVLTTCALDYITWANHYPPGVERIGELDVRRFPVEKPRDVDSFGRLSQYIRPRIGTLSPAEEEQWLREQGPWSPALFDHLEKHAPEYDAFFFFTYLYATTCFGLPRVAQKAVLVPTAHDEWPIYLRFWDGLFAQPRAFVFQTPEEREFLRGRFPQSKLNGPVLGVAVDPPERVDAEGFRRAQRIDGPFLLYAGRVDTQKGVGELLEHFARWQRQAKDARTSLLLVGKPAMEIPPLPRVRVLGFVSEQEKWDAIAACEALVLPSAYESLSIACLEAWTLGKPVLVNAKSEVLVGQCRRTNGGLWYRDGEEFCAALDALLGDESVRRTLGAQGQRFVSAHYRWPAILDGYCGLIEPR